MATNVEIDRALAAVTATLNDQKLDEFDTPRVQDLVTQALGGEQALRVDDGGRLHDTAGVRVGAIRRTPSGEWITDRQNETAWRSGTAIPAQPSQSKLRGVLTRLKVFG